MENTTANIKTFWEKPEGLTGMILGIGAIALGGWALFLALPTLIVLLQNTLIAAGLGVVAVFLATILMDKKNWILAYAMYQSLMRAITGLFVTIDPIGIIENYIRTLKGKIENINHQLEVLSGQKSKVGEQINLAKKKKQEALLLAQQAEKEAKKGKENAQSMSQQVGLNAKEAQRQQDFIDNIMNMYNKIDFLYRVLTKIMENSQVVLKDTENEVAMKKQERETWIAASSAVRSAQSILIGNPNEQALFEMGMQEVANQIAQKTGEMDRFMDRTKEIMNNIDLRNGVMQDQGMKLLEQFENEQGSILLSDKDKKRILAQSSTASDEIEEEVTVGRK
jgi:hypothetical protein